MATVTYAYKTVTSEGTGWANGANAVDSDNNVYATCNVKNPGWSGQLVLTDNECPGTNLGTITGIRVGGRAKASETTGIHLYVATQGRAAAAVVGTLHTLEFLYWRNEFAWPPPGGWDWATLDTFWCGWVIKNDRAGYNYGYIDYTYVEVTYTPTPSGPDLEKISGVDGANVGKIHGVSWSDVESVHGVG